MWFYKCRKLVVFEEVAFWVVTDGGMAGVVSALCVAGALWILRVAVS